MAGTSSAKKGSRSPSPAPKKKATTATPKATPKPKVSAAKSRATPIAKETKTSEKKRRSSPKKKEEAETEEVDGTLLSEDVQEIFEAFMFEMLVDTTVVHNVIRVQYLQCYILAGICLASSFSEAVVPLPMLVGSSSLVEGMVGCLGLAQAFSLTAAAQTSYSGMKKALQYNMMFHLLTAFIFIVHQNSAVERYLQPIVAVCCLNVGLNMWACYFKEPKAEISDEEEIEE